jgi:hypothetical protein
MIRMSQVKKIMSSLSKLKLELEDAINQTIYKYEDDYFAFYDEVVEAEYGLEYKGVIVYSEDKEKIGQVDYYYLDKSMKEYLVLKNV